MNKVLSIAMIGMLFLSTGCAKESTILGLAGSVDTIDQFIEGKSSGGTIAFGGDTTSVKALIDQRKVKKYEDQLQVEVNYWTDGIVVYFNDTVEVLDVTVEYFGEFPRTVVEAHGMQLSMKNGKYIVNRNIQSLRFMCYNENNQIIGASMYLTIKIKKDDITFTKKVNLSPM